MATYSLRQIARLILENESNMPPDTVVKGICVDTRLLNPGEIFFALPGCQVDGHQYLEQAASKGAVAAVVLTTYLGPNYGLSLIKVQDVLAALQTLAKKVLHDRASRVVAITGSVGKTTTKDFIAAILKEKYRVASSPGNSNSQIGLPLAILNHTNGDEDFLVLEMGMTNSGQIAKLIDIAPPHISVLTSVEYAHACYFPSIEAIARSKAEIFQHPKTVRGILPLSIPNFQEVFHTGKCAKTTFSVHKHGADYVLNETLRGTKIEGEKKTINLPHLPLPGKHNLHNLTAAIALARSLSVEWEIIAKAIPKLELPERRLQTVEKKGVLFINDSYNAIPVAVKAALKSLPIPRKGGKRIAVLGDMLELGELTEKMHHEVGEVALSCVDHMFCFGDHCKPIQECWTKAKKPVALFTDFNELVTELKKHALPGDIVLLKGSRKKGMWRVLDAFEESKS